MIKINGEFLDKSGLTVTELIAELGYQTRFIAVELNGGILKKNNYDSTVLKDGDTVEVVNFVGGG